MGGIVLIIRSRFSIGNLVWFSLFLENTTVFDSELQEII